ncbi:hypothetical protein MVES1_000044 [Malassezia vespertilionis]|uniref:uncharacterized protein n=1 Tax=Malassezia vespertilionis TaxID=2020962 RepID=UPI0024B1888E|nr:uncharacterized protein MVES1_000044 [Malassezia vespertilionis]WFD04720.1 hypothetical protein MVES1_000044 [Malassezia vespertilionis]
MSPAPTPKRFMITPGTTGAWVALFPDYNDFEQAVHKYELKITWLQTLLLQIPDRMRWMLTQRYQLRLSWPANIPADFLIHVHTPEKALHKQKQAPVDEGPLQPCELLFAKISAVSTGTRLRVDELASSAHWLLHLAEHLGGWAAPLRRDAQDIPVDVTFERVYLGCIPQSTLPLILYLCIATVAASLLSTRVLRIVAHATRPTK